MQLEAIEQGLSIIYQVAEIIIGFIIIIGVVFYLGTLIKKEKLYDSRLYEHKISFVVNGTFFFLVLLLIMILIYPYMKSGYHSVNPLSLITIMFYISINFLYMVLWYRKVKVIKLTWSKSILYAILYIIGTVIYLSLWIYTVIQPSIQYILIFITFIYFLSYIYIEGIIAGKEFADNRSKVTVITTYGEEENLKLYQTTNTDYRFIRNRGKDNEEEIIIPINKVMRIITKKVEK